MAEEFKEHGISFVFVYTREAHPCDERPAHASIDQKIANAKDMVDRWEIKRPMLVDDLDGTTHRAFGTLPNMTYILSASGTVLYRASWTDERTIKMALDQILFERGLRRERTRVSPYYVEWLPGRTNERQVFMQGLANNAGPRAVEEFIDAIAHTAGDAAAGPARQWWAELQAFVKATERTAR